MRGRKGNNTPPRSPTSKTNVNRTLVTVTVEKEKKKKESGSPAPPPGEDERVCLDSPGDAAVVEPLLSPHDDVESAAEVVWLHIHDLMMTRREVVNKRRKIRQEAELTHTFRQRQVSVRY